MEDYLNRANDKPRFVYPNTKSMTRVRSICCFNYFSHPVAILKIGKGQIIEASFLR